jgi:hypothetical protein
VNKGFLKLISLCLVGVLLSVPGYAQNYRVKAERYERGIYSPETNPPSVRYAIIDLGPDVEPIRLSNSGHVLCQPTKFGKLQSRWYQGQFQELTGGDDSRLIGTLDMNDAGTVVGSVFEYKIGTAGGLPPCPDSEGAWYRNPSYGIRRAAAWYAGSGAASTLGQPAYGFNIYDCTVPHGPPYSGTTTFGSAWTIDDSGNIYGEAMAAYAEHQSYDGFFLPTVPGVAYSGFGFGGTGILGDLSLVYDPAHNIFNTQGTSYRVRKVRNGVTMGYDSKGKNLVNSLPVDFTPVTMNSQGLVLGAVVVDNFFSGYTKFLIYDPLTRTQTDLPMRASRFFGPGQFHPPVALNHRTIAVTDSSGQTTFKKSPQIVGPDGAFIWEENPKTGQYFYQSLNLLIPPDSGWHLTTAKAINDSGTILCRGTYQGQTRACLLVPAVFAARNGEINHGFDPTGPEPWASVGVSGASEVVEFRTAADLSDRITFAVASGGESLDMTATKTTPGVVNIALSGKSTAGTAVVEAKLDGTVVVGRLNVLVLPQRTLTVAIYRIEDSGSPKTAIAGSDDAAVNDEMLKTMNAIFVQAAVKFTLVASERRKLSYDKNGDGILNTSDPNNPSVVSELPILEDQTWTGQIRLFLFNQGPAGKGGGAFEKGDKVYAPAAILYVQSGGRLALHAAHECGHVLKLPTMVNSPDGSHDLGPWPPDTWGLMVPGSPAEPPGKWLRRQDWDTANTTAGGL